MATDAITIETVNIEELQAAFRAAPELTTRYVKYLDMFMGFQLLSA